MLVMVVGGFSVDRREMLYKFCNVLFLTFYFVHSDAMYSVNTEYVAISASTNCLVKKGDKQNREELQNCLKNHIRQQMPCFWLNAGVCN